MKNTWKMLAASVLSALCATGLFADQEYIVTYLWHMHQPIYYPYVSINDSSQYFNFSVPGVFDGDRISAYTTWPKDAVQQGADRGMPHAGAQVSYSGSLGENCNNLWGYNANADGYRWGRNGLRTSMNNPRLDIVGIPYHHSLMPLTCKESMIMQIKLHKEQYTDRWNTGGYYSKGFWPPECAFDETIIPALVAEGLEWVIVDNGHLFRTVEDFPWSSASSCRPNPADMVNGSSTNLKSTWVGLQNVWAPTKVLAPWSYQPHYVQYVNPYTGTKQKIVAVPAGRYEGNENGRGGYGSFKPENVWGSITGVNTNPSAPMMILCHSDGDNYGMKNSDAWNGQHGTFLGMCQSNGQFDHWSVQDYLDTYPVNANDIIHVESGSWIGIDGGTPYYEKWLASNYNNDGSSTSGENPDRWSWSVLVAAQNRVILADTLDNSYSMNDVEWGIGNDTAKAWHYYLNGETSCYWYWDYDRTNPWDGNVTRACNMAVTHAMNVINAHPNSDTKGPSIFPPQRSSWNPGAYLWDEKTPQDSNFTVWSYVDDVSGLGAVRLCWRTDKDGFNPISSIQNETFAGGSEVNAWNIQSMTGSWDPSTKGPVVPDPVARAQMFKSQITGQNNVLIDYFVEAVDSLGNTNRSDIKHVFVGSYSNSAPQNYVDFVPAAPSGCVPVTIKYKKTGSLLTNASSVYIHIGRNAWADAENHLMTTDTDTNYWTYTYTTPAETYQVICCFSNTSGVLDNNSGADYSVSVANCDTNYPMAVFDPAAPSACEPVRIMYSTGSEANGVLAGATPVYIHVGYNGWQGVVSPDPVMTATNGRWEYLYYPPAGTRTINVCFNDGGSIWENNNGQNYSAAMTDCEGTNAAVTFNPAVPTEEQPVTITYNADGRVLTNASAVYATITCDDWSTYDIYPMTNIGTHLWAYTHLIPNNSSRLTVNFKNSNGATFVEDNNDGWNWVAEITAAPDTNVLQFFCGSPEITAAGSPNNIGDNFDLTEGASPATVHEAGFGRFGKVYVNYDETNLYIGAYGMDVAGSNNALCLFLSVDTLAKDADNLWNCSGAPAGLDNLHNVAFFPPADVAILLGDVWGDGNFTDFNLVSGSPFGQGLFTIETNGFAAMNGARLSQFDGMGTISSGSTWDDTPARGTKRWECAIPWTNLNATSLAQLTNVHLSGIFVSASTNGNDRYLSASYLGSSIAGTLDEYGNYGYSFVTLTGQKVALPDDDLDGDGVPDSWKAQIFGSSYTITEQSDFDGDGFADWKEYMADTNPKSDSSLLAFLPPEYRSNNPGQIQIGWYAVPGRYYDLLMCTNLLNGEFTVLQSGVQASGGTLVITGAVDAVNNAYYKVRTRRGK